MSVPLHTRWTKQLEAAELDPSWKARLEKRVLRFMLARYKTSGSLPLLGDFPLYWAESPPGRVRVAPTRRQLRYRIRRISRTVQRARSNHIFFLDWLFGAEEDPVQSRPASLEETVAEAIEELEEFVAGQVEGESATRFQENMHKKRSDMRW